MRDTVCRVPLQETKPCKAVPGKAENRDFEKKTVKPENYMI